MGGSRGKFIPNQGEAIADGDITEWILSGNDYVTTLVNSGNCPGTNCFDVGKLYVRWDCNKKTLCALFLLDTNRCLAVNSNNFFEDYGRPLEGSGKPSATYAILNSPNQGWEGTYGGSKRTAKCASPGASQCSNSN